MKFMVWMLQMSFTFYIIFAAKALNLLGYFLERKNSSISNVVKNIIYTIVMHVLYELRVRRPVFRPPNT